MKLLFAVLLSTMSISAAAQTADVLYRQACGPKDTSFDVRQVEGQPPAAPEPGKALVYFVQESIGANYTVRIGLDGAWVGAIKNSSFIVVSVAPGEHHSCAGWEKNLRYVKNPTPQLSRFTAEAGKVYYYLVRSTGANVRAETLDLSLADRDEALFLIASSPQSVAKPKP